jgi:eukaryotic-like serine/threonine-protein kinase
MATGRQTFSGPTRAVVTGRILHESPPTLAKLNPDAPAQLGEIVRKALEKDRDLRYQSAAEIRADLRRLKRDLESVQARAVEASSLGHKRGKLALTAILALIAVAVVFTLLRWWPRSFRAETSRALVERELTANPSENPVYATAISPDGRYLAFADFTGVFLKTLETGETHSLKLPEGFCFR